MAHIKLLDPFKKELRDMVVYTLAEFGATSVKRFNKELDDIKHRQYNVKSHATIKMIRNRA